MDWERDLRDWPNSAYSRRIRHGPHEWHVQDMGEGPTLLLLHGAGGSVHSWRSLAPTLSESYRVVAIDLPGHGFTRLGSFHRSSLDGMGDDIACLCEKMNWTPRAVIGHSAGAAIGLRLGQKGVAQTLIGLNPALAPFRGLAAVMFPMAARFLATTPFVVDTVLRSLATPDRVENLLLGTGSHIESRGIVQYTRLFQSRSHLDGTFSMMANWRLDPLLRDLPRIQTPCLFLCGGQDKTVPPDIALNAASRLPDARVEVIEEYGHLMHEEAPELVARWVSEWLVSPGVSESA